MSEERWEIVSGGLDGHRGPNPVSFNVSLNGRSVQVTVSSFDSSARPPRQRMDFVEALRDWVESEGGVVSNITGETSISYELRPIPEES